MNRYFYDVGDEVYHSECVEMKGTIIKQVSLDEEIGEPTNTPDPSNPWYFILWEDDQLPMIDGHNGFEHQNSLLPSFVNRVPHYVIHKLYHVNIELWNELTSQSLQELKDF